MLCKVIITEIVICHLLCIRYHSKCFECNLFNNINMLLSRLFFYASINTGVAGIIYLKIAYCLIIFSLIVYILNSFLVHILNIYIHICMYIYIYVCVCVYIYVYLMIFNNYWYCIFCSSKDTTGRSFLCSVTIGEFTIRCWWQFVPLKLSIYSPESQWSIIYYSY